MMSRLVAFMLCFCANITSAQTVTMFGLPLGGKLVTEPKICLVDASKTKTLCWIDRPFKAKDGSRQGGVAIPEVGLPSWAMYQNPEISLSNRGELQSIRFSSETLLRVQSDIQASISSRFGKPSVFSQIIDLTNLRWYATGVEVRMACTPNQLCIVEFLSATEIAEREKLLTTRKAQDAARPKSP